MDKHMLKALVETFSSQEIIVVGDTIVDHYIRGTLLGTSAETPTIVARELGEEFSLGGAFLVCRNLLALQGKVHFLTLLGDDREADFIESFEHPNFTLLPMRNCGRKTTVKRRYWVDGYKLLQFDQLDETPFTNEEVVIEAVRSRIDSASALILSDYRHGLLTERLIPQLIHLAREKSVPVYVDSQVSQKASNHLLYQGATLMCLNKKEAFAACPDMKELQFDLLKDRLKNDNIVVKDGANGSIASIGDELYITPAFSVEAIDTCGAGDAFLAALALSGLTNPAASLMVANLWAGLSTEVLGPQPPSYDTLIQRIGDVRTVTT